MKSILLKKKLTGLGKFCYTFSVHIHELWIDSDEYSIVSVWTTVWLFLWWVSIELFLMIIDSTCSFHLLIKYQLLFDCEFWGCSNTPNGLYRFVHYTFYRSILIFASFSWLLYILSFNSYNRFISYKTCFHNSHCTLH